MIKALGILLASVVFGAVGQIFFKKGVNSISERGFRFFVKALQNRFIWIGIITTTLYFFLWMAVLRMADVSWALPLRSIQYLLVAVMAILFLEEKISKKRWIGIGLGMGGIFFIVQSWGG